MSPVHHPRRLGRRAFALRIAVLVGLGIVAVVAVFFVWPRPLPQDSSYHAFADQRPWLGVPNFLNVVSNFPFLVWSGLGVWFLWSKDATRPAGPLHEPWERWPYLLLFLGVGLIGLGSAYYHWEPNNDRLVWDRLPMTVAFMSLFAIVVSERMNPKLGALLVIPLVALGVASVMYWHWGELHGQGDLRFYILVQFYPIAAIPLILLLFPPHYTRTADFFGAVAWYVLAKGLETPAMDQEIFALGHVVSGHTLKHLASAMGVYWIYRMLKARTWIG